MSEGEIRSIADAIRDHYKPQGPSDAVPSEPVSIAVALADKLDTLVGFWAIDEKPTGSKDPFALRRAALGVVRIVLENGVRLPLANQLLSVGETNLAHSKIDWMGELDLIKSANLLDDVVPLAERVKLYGIFGYLLKSDGRFQTSLDYLRRVVSKEQTPNFEEQAKAEKELFAALERYNSDALDFKQALLEPENTFLHAEDFSVTRESVRGELEPLLSDLLAFFADRLKQYLRDQGQRHDLIDAVFALGEDDLVLIVKRVEALAAFLDSEDGANLLAGYKRAANILRAEEKKDKRAFDGAVDAAKLEAKAETALFKAISASAEAVTSALEKEDFAAAMSALASLRAPVDAFFDGPDSVMVNADDAGVRENRLNLLNMMRAAMGRVADFSKIEG